MTPTEMHIDALMEKIEDLELKISLMIDPIVFNSMSAEYADHLSRLSDQNKKLEAENARYREALEYFMGCVMTVDEATIPKLGIESNPKQVVFNLSCSYVRILKAREALKGE